MGCRWIWFQWGKQFKIWDQMRLVNEKPVVTAGNRPRLDRWPLDLAWLLWTFTTPKIRSGELLNWSWPSSRSTCHFDMIWVSCHILSSYFLVMVVSLIFIAFILGNFLMCIHCILILSRPNSPYLISPRNPLSHLSLYTGLPGILFVTQTGLEHLAIFLPQPSNC